MSLLESFHGMFLIVTQQLLTLFHPKIKCFQKFYRNQQNFLNQFFSIVSCSFDPNARTVAEMILMGFDTAG